MPARNRLRQAQSTAFRYVCFAKALASNSPHLRYNIAPMLRIVIADDHHVVRAGLAAFLDQEDDIVVVGQVADGALIKRAVEQHQPDLLLLDAHMPNHRVLETAVLLTSQFPQTRILVLSAYKRREYVVGLLDAGVAGYVLKDDPHRSLLQAIHTVKDGGQWISPRVLDVLVASAKQPEPVTIVALTEREKEVLSLIGKGLRNSEIAATLTVTEQTVKNYVRRVFGKIGAETRVGAVLFALKNGFAQVDET